MKETSQLSAALRSYLQPGLSIGITSHIEPDGDGFCASIALQAFLRTMNIQSDIVIDESNLDRFVFLMQGARLIRFQPELSYDLLFILDCNSLSRLGSRAQLVKSAGHCFVIDHHVPENGIIPADFSYVDTSASSVGAILFRALQHEIEALPPAQRLPICNCLYTSIINDTNNFTNANTDIHVLQIAADLCACGINPSEIYRAFFHNQNPLELRYIGEVLSTIELHHEGRVLFMYSTLDMQRRNQLRADSIMNVTRWVQGVRGVLVICYLREDSSGQFKLSLRSRSIDVNAVAASYGGGGHKSASGAVLNGNASQIKLEILDILKKELDADRAHGAD